MYEIHLKPAAVKELDQLPAKIRIRVVAALEELREDPRPSGCHKLQGADDLWRIRIGQYRVVYAIDDDVLTVLVVRVAHRKDVYRP